MHRGTPQELGANRGPGRPYEHPSMVVPLALHRLDAIESRIAMNSASHPKINAPATSKRLSKALEAEIAALERRARQIRREQDQLRERLAALDLEAQAIDERLVLISSLHGGGLPDEAIPDDGCPQLLAGPAIRMAAVALLRDRPEGHGPLHYKAWLEIVEKAGYEVAGRKPAATFLSQITRSPVVQRTSRSGYYEIDREAPARLRRKLAALHAELRNGGPPEDVPIDLGEVRRRRGELAREVAALERDLAEAIAALTAPVDEVAASA